MLLATRSTVSPEGVDIFAAGSHFPLSAYVFSENGRTDIKKGPLVGRLQVRPRHSHETLSLGLALDGSQHPDEPPGSFFCLNGN